MPCGAVTAQGCFGVSSVSSDKCSKWNRTIENLSRSFVLIGAQGFALLNPLSWSRQNPPVTIWLLLKLVDKMQARLKLPSANWGWLYRPYTLRLRLHPDTYTTTHPRAQKRKPYNIDSSFQTSVSPRLTTQSPRATHTACTLAGGFKYRP